jgi:hypothetical protein
MNEERDYSAKELEELAGGEENVCTHQKEYRGKSGGIHNWISCGGNIHVGTCPLNDWEATWNAKVNNETEYVF